MEIQLNDIKSTMEIILNQIKEIRNQGVKGEKSLKEKEKEKEKEKKNKTHLIRNNIENK